MAKVRALQLGVTDFCLCAMYHKFWFNTYTVSAPILILDSSVFCVHELTVSCCFMFFVVVFAAVVFLFCSDIAPRGIFSIICSRLVPFEDSGTML